MTKRLAGDQIAKEITEEIKVQIAQLPKNKRPHLAAILVGNNSASELYLSMKERACQAVGMGSNLITLKEGVSEEKLIETIERLNRDPKVSGILVQLPLPAHICTQTIFQAIDPAKDVDGFHPINMGKLLLGYDDGLIPCTPLGVQQLLLRSGISLTNKHVVIVGRSSLVGKPLAALLMQKDADANATVTICHSGTDLLASHTTKADILVAAIGHPRFIRAEMVKQGATVVDVGINRDQNNQLCGDVAFDEVAPKCQYISPVPKGVGPMTVAMLLHNTFLAFTRQPP